MNYAQAIDRLFQTNSSSLNARGSDDPLANAHALDRALSDPTSSYPTIHIAGSNGKGSVTTKIAKALEFSGYRVGVYTSPHLFSFRERIAINGELISEEDVARGLEKIYNLVDELNLSATFFEQATFLAFDYFRKKAVDVAVIETGLGGRWDATNVIHPELTVITSISREHAQILGENTEQIAAEKAGILKEKIPVVLGPKARAQSIYNRAKELNCPVFASKKISYFFDEENTSIAQLVLQQASAFNLKPEALEKGLSFRPPCRFEKVGEAILDVAHNPDAIFYLLQALHHFYPRRKFRFVVGFSKDKEYDVCLGLIADVAAHIHLVQAASLRAATTDELQNALKNEDPSLSTSHSSIEEGVQLAYAEALAQGEILVICGSFYIMAEAKEALGTGTQFPKDSLDLNAKILPSALSC